MGGTHQSHNIPWQVLVELYELEPEYWKLPGGGKTGDASLRLRRDWDKDRIFKAMRHFARRLAKSVEEFAATEAQKLNLPDRDIKLDDTGVPDLVLYDEGEIDSPPYSSPYYRTLKGWMDHKSSSVYCSPYNETLSDLANRLLISDSRWQSLVVLGRHGFPFHRRLSSMCWQFDYDDYLRPYILVNMATAIDPAWLTKPVQTWLKNVRLDNIVNWHGRTICHQRFFCRVNHEYRTHFYSDDVVKSGPDLEVGLPGYLSLLFRSLYRYHVMMMQCGRRVNWELATLCALPCYGDILHYQRWPKFDDILEPLTM